MADAVMTKHGLVAQALSSEIRGGKYKIGDRLPSEPQLSERYGVSRGAVAGVLKRIRDDLAKADAAPLRRGEVAAYWPENLDGGMAPRWWDAGLRQRKTRIKPPISTQGRRS